MKREEEMPPDKMNTEVYRSFRNLKHKKLEKNPEPAQHGVSPVPE